MKTAARKSLPLLLLIAVAILFHPVIARAAEATRNLLSHGTEHDYWAANVAPSPDPRAPGAHTSIRYRTAGDVEWREIAQFAAPAIGLANRGGELLVILAGGSGGQWAIVAGNGDVRSGAALPGGAEVLDLAGDGDDDVWAVAAAPRGKTLATPPATATTSTANRGLGVPPERSGETPKPRQGTTSSTTATSALLTAPALPPHDVGIFRLHLGQWSEQDVLPGGVRREDVRALSLIVIEHRLMLALAAGLEVRVYTHGPQGWDEGSSVAVLNEGGDIKLLNDAGRPLLWMSDPSGPGTLFVRGEQRWSEPIKLQPSPKLATYDRRALVVALGRLRMLASNAAGQLAEQFYKLDGSLDGEPSKAVTIPRGGDERLSQLLQVLIAVVLIVWMIGSLQQRPALRQAVARADQLHLAPLKLRLIGGLVDMIPLLVGFIVADVMLRKSGEPIAARLTLQSTEFAFIAAGVGTYLLLTTVLELLLARSIGKLVTGTRIAALDGRRPPATAVLIRNLLRVVDLLMLFFPLSFVIFSPLRQRIGDMAAGTIVITNDAPEPPPAPPDSSSQPPTDEA